MNDYFNTFSDIAVLLYDTEKDYPVAERLLAAGHTVYICGNHSELTRLYHQGKRPLVLTHIDYVAPLNERSLQSLLHTAQLLNADVLHQLGLQQTTRHAGQNDTSTTDASSKAHAFSRAEPTWILTPGPRRMNLRLPSGTEIPLTPTEARFIRLLFSSPEATVEREHWQNQEGQDDSRDLHNLAVIVSRLRQKVHSRGHTFPLRALRGSGYFFSANCYIDN